MARIAERLVGRGAPPLRPHAIATTRMMAARREDVLVGDVYTLLPFGNVAVVRELTGAQLWEGLEHSVSRLPASDGRFLQIAGLKFEAKVSNALGSRIVKVTLADGTDVSKTSTTKIKIVTNDFTNAGGDGFLMLKEARPSSSLKVRADIVLDYVKAQMTLSPASLSGRIMLTP